MLFNTSENCYFYPCVYLHLVWFSRIVMVLLFFSFFFSLVFCDRGFKFNAENTACSACEVGMYKQQRGNNDTCEACPTNTTTADVASTSESSCDRGKQTNGQVCSIFHNVNNTGVVSTSERCTGTGVQHFPPSPPVLLSPLHLRVTVAQGTAKIQVCIMSHCYCCLFLKKKKK